MTDNEEILELGSASQSVTYRGKLVTVKMGLPEGVNFKTPSPPPLPPPPHPLLLGQGTHKLCKNHQHFKQDLCRFDIPPATFKMACS